MRTICLHHNDHDGHMSAYQIYSMLKFQGENLSAEDFYECDYDKIESDEILEVCKMNTVYIVDLSFTTRSFKYLEKIIKVAKTVVWIDHHASSLDVVKEFKDELDDFMKEDKLIYLVCKKFSGAALCDIYSILLHRGVEKAYAKGKLEIADGEPSALGTNIKFKYDGVGFDYNLRMYLSYVDDYDTWKNKYEKAKYFILSMTTHGFKFIKTLPDGSKTFNNLYKDYYANSTNMERFKKLVEDGETVYKYVMTNYEGNLGSCYESMIGDKVVLVKNGEGNSWNFCDKIKDYPATILFDYSDGKYNYSIYSQEGVEGRIDCKEIAEANGGGGHVGASGFSAPKIIFPPIKNPKNRIIFLGGTCNESTWRDDFIKEFYDKYEKQEEIILFNPVVEDWDEEAQRKENKMKDEAFVHLYVITPDQTGVFSFAEIMDSTHTKNTVVVIDPDEFKDEAMSRSVKAVLDLAKKRGAKTCSDLDKAVKYCGELIGAKEK